MKFEQKLIERLQQHDKQQLYRHRFALTSPQSAEITIGAKHYLNFSSNDYLGLANDAALKQSYIKAVAEFGVGAGASQLISGHNQQHQLLEEELAQLLKRPRALVFPSGHMANLALLTALTGKNDLILQDKLNHASLIDGGMFAAATMRRYPHLQTEVLQQWLAEVDSDFDDKFIVTDSVFSMEGAIAPLPQLAAIAKQYNATLIADDAHGFGVLGKYGGGAAEYFELNGTDLPIIMVTFGKALGCFGAAVVASDAVIEALIQFGRSYIYTTALPPAMAAVTRTALKIMQQQSWRREKLQQLVQHFIKGAKQLQLPLVPSFTAIQPLIVGDETKALNLSAKLEAAGIIATAIRPPTVPVNKCRLRLTFSASHSIEHVDRLLDTCEKIFKGEKIL